MLGTNHNTFGTTHTNTQQTQHAVYAVQPAAGQDDSTKEVNEDILQSYDLSKCGDCCRLQLLVCATSLRNVRQPCDVGCPPLQTQHNAATASHCRVCSNLRPEAAATWAAAHPSSQSPLLHLCGDEVLSKQQRHRHVQQQGRHTVSHKDQEQDGAAPLSRQLRHTTYHMHNVLHDYVFKWQLWLFGQSQQRALGCSSPVVVSPAWTSAPGS